MTMGAPAIDEWFQVQDAYHKAVETYNLRLALVRAERERGNWTMKLDAEYDAMHKAQGAAFRANEALYQTLLTNGEKASKEG